MAWAWRKWGPKSTKKKTSHSLVPSQRFPLYFLSSPCLQPLKTPHKPFSSTNRRRLSLPTSLNPHQRHNSHRELLPLPYADFLLLLPLPLTANSSTVPRSDVARTISSASWSRSWPLPLVVFFSARLHLLQPFWLHAERELFTFYK